MKTLTLVIPVYNEEKRIPETVTALNQFRALPDVKIEKVIFVNDGSTDKTLDLLKAAKIQFPTEIISYKINKGKGRAVRVGMLVVQSDYGLFMDADMSTPLEELRKFVPFFQENIPVVIGSRKINGSNIVANQSIRRQLLGRGFTLLSKLILNTWVGDFTCGFKAFNREAISFIFPKAQIDRWGFDSEILFLARRGGFRIQEKPVTWINDRNSKVDLKRDVVTSFLDLINIRLNEWRGLYNQKAALRNLGYNPW